jgi:hypothetical protein
MDLVVSTVPTRPQIDRLQTEISKMPQASVETEHYFHAGMYCRKVTRAAGTLIVGKVHKQDHFFLCAKGEIVAWSEKGMVRLAAGDIIESKPGTKRVTLAITDAIGITFHKTDETDLDKIEAALVEPDATALFDSDNKVKFDVPAFREITKKVIAGEKPGFWSDWTEEQQQMYTNGDWLAFSKSRGYSDEEIADYAKWREMILEAKGKQMDPYHFIRDLTTEAALKNIALDTKGEILKSSHAPFEPRGEVA